VLGISSEAFYLSDRDSTSSAPVPRHRTLKPSVAASTTETILESRTPDVDPIYGTSNLILRTLIMIAGSSVFGT